MKRDFCGPGLATFAQGLIIADLERPNFLNSVKFTPKNWIKVRVRIMTRPYPQPGQKCPDQETRKTAVQLNPSQHPIFKQKSQQGPLRNLNSKNVSKMVFKISIDTGLLPCVISKSRPCIDSSVLKMFTTTNKQTCSKKKVT